MMDWSSSSTTLADRISECMLTGDWPDGSSDPLTGSASRGFDDDSVIQTILC